MLTLALEGGPDDLFPTRAFESAALGDGTDLTKGLDPPPSAEARSTLTREERPTT